jgi:hypothetical protein
MHATAAGRDDHRMSRDLLRWQFDLTWSLAELHLDRLTTEDHLWEPAAHCWTVRRADDGAWTPDWADTEPDPIPVPTIAWISWHMGWWWSVATDHAQGREPRERTAVTWPGPDAAVGCTTSGSPCWTGSPMPTSPGPPRSPGRPTPG